ncbi:hypothetical protein V5P93_002755 [Actinokineospora auranticolor]|uniref:Uncharacterized protein n=1 Tax=Actinokineospora auranticolor TaxID=155976 RepID=A0A2S6H0E9_9PSEU|nr:hypothetical protein [Actinokineospora auranticolor]PPK70896.1 hypothetical protein CLV40_10182 [Actinokineospora auranticolor]
MDHDVPTTREIRALPPAAALLTGGLLTLIGLTWDVQWHTDVGPDTFFTLPHLFLYAGSAVSGLASLTAVLMTTAARRAGRPTDPAVGGAPVGVFGRVFTAPLGYLVAGCGAASFLLYGLWDQWWHGLYGFDAVIDSPPHIGLLTSVMATLVGTVVVFAAAVDQRWGRIGAIVSLAVLAAFSTITVVAFETISRPVNAVHVAMAGLMVLIVATGAAFTRFGGVLVAAALAVVQAVSWWFSPWAAEVYADAVGLPLRDYVDGVPVMPALMPMVLIPAALLVHPLLTARARWAPALAGAVAGALVAGLQVVQNSIVYDFPTPAVSRLLPTALAGAVLGLLAGHAGTRLGGALRHAKGFPTDESEAS